MASEIAIGPNGDFQDMPNPPVARIPMLSLMQGAPGMAQFDPLGSRVEMAERAEIA